MGDSQHESLRPAIYQACSPDPARFRLLGSRWQLRAYAPGRMGTCGYEVANYDLFADGPVFCRTGNGDLLA